VTRQRRQIALAQPLAGESHDLGQALGGRTRGLDVVQKARERAERAARDGERAEREHELLELHASLDDLVGSKQRESRDDEDRERLDERRRDRAGDAGATVRTHDLAVRCGEAAARESLGGRGLDAAQPLHRFVRGAQEFLIRGERVLAAAADALAELLEDECKDRCHHDRGDREPPVEPDGGDEGS
jgi:hypothetical protein